MQGSYRAYGFSVIGLAMGAVAIGADAQGYESGDEPEISEITVRASRIANTRPAGSYATLATLLRFHPSTELQSRGLPEGQADVAVRGGLFENTGFRVGAVTVMDPQTGHYTAGLPIDPASLSAPKRLTDIDNALGGFNSTTATVAWSIPRLAERSTVGLGAGSDSLLFQSLRVTAPIHTGDGGSTLTAALAAASSQADGSLANGDHDFERYNLHLQRASAGAQSDLILAYQDKFYGWPGAYTGFATLPETDHTQTTFILANHRHRLERGWLEFGAYHRRLVNDYDFDRTTAESGAAGSFEHETLVNALGMQGMYRSGDIDWRFGGQVTADELQHSTDLTQGDFSRRRYLKLAVVPSLNVVQSAAGAVTLRFGATLDASDQDHAAVSPLAGVTLTRSAGERTTFVGLEYAETSQVPGYTALKSPPAGLFGGNAQLGREKARQFAFSLGRETPGWDARLTVFHRADDDLVDWTYFRGAPFARQANALDADVTGVEALFARSWTHLDVAAGYAWIDKDADYGSATVDASFYALNYARHRVTLAATWRWSDRLEWRLDSEYREQQDNPLRNSDDDAVIVSLALAWEPPDGRGPGLTLSADNLTDSDYEQFPGTPAVGRQISLRAGYGW